jgi:hypothetical protein
MVGMFPTKVGPTVSPTIGPSVGTNNPWVDGFTLEPMSKTPLPFTLLTLFLVGGPLGPKLVCICALFCSV